MMKPELLILVRSIPVNKKYTVYKMFLNAGQTVMCLPPYRADLNPVKLVWGGIKGRVGECLFHSMEEEKQLCLKLFSEYSVEK